MRDDKDTAIMPLPKIADSFSILDSEENFNTAFRIPKFAITPKNKYALNAWLKIPKLLIVYTFPIIVLNNTPETPTAILLDSVNATSFKNLFLLISFKNLLINFNIICSSIYFVIFTSLL